MQAIEAELKSFCSNIGSFNERIGQEIGAWEQCQLHASRIIEIDNRMAGWFSETCSEEFALRGKIRIDRFMIIQMVLRQVGEGRHGELQTIDTMHIERNR